jgi:adenylosuccinate lyase
MATKEAVAQLAMLPERVGIVETKVEHLNEKMDDLKVDVKDMHDCLDQTRDTIVKQLDEMLKVYEQNRDRYYEKAEEVQQHNLEQHNALAGKIKELETVKAKWTTYAFAGMAFLGGAGITGHVSLPTILKFLGL